MWVLFFTHNLFMVNCTFNATPTDRLQQHPLLFTTNRIDRTFFLWRLQPAQPSHPSHGTILLWSGSSSSKCANLHTVAASNNRDHSTRSLHYCMVTPHIYMGVIIHAHPVRGRVDWFKSSNKNQKYHVVLKHCVMSVPHLISILIGFRLAYTVIVQKAKSS